MKNFFFIFLLFFYACEKETQSPDDGNSLSDGVSKELDLNKDGIVDFKTKTKTLSLPVVGYSGGETFNSLHPLNETKLAFKSSGDIFKKGDTISLNMEGYSWYSLGRDIVSKYSNGKYWKTDFTSTSKYLAMQFNQDDTLKIGWIEISVDTICGEIFINKWKISDTDNIIIE